MDRESTTLIRATNKSHSLRTTVPAGIARQFKLKEGDKLEWKIEPRKNNLIIVVMPISSGNNRGGV